MPRSSGRWLWMRGTAGRGRIAGSQRATNSAATPDLNACKGGILAERKPISIGTRFGRIVVLAPILPKAPPYYYECSCDCGRVFTRTNRALRGKSLSCGCLRVESNLAAVVKHGLNKSSEHRIWVSMRSRCHNKEKAGYARYGGRGITVCERWRDFSNFLADMGPRPSQQHQIDRIDNNGNYEPGNCRWTTRAVQMQNTSRNVNVTINGETFCAKEWERRTGINSSTILSRVYAGWPEHMLLTTRLHVKVKPTNFTMLTFDGVTLPLKDMARRYGLTPKALSTRLSRGFSLDRALTQPQQKRAVVKPQM